MLYRLAVETGLRRGELASLTRASFDLDPAHPTVAVEAGYSKHRRRDVLPLRPDTAAELAEILASKLPNAPALRMPRGRHESVGMFRADLAAGRAAWLAKAATAEERNQREGTSFLLYLDAAGRYADFHSLRHTCGSLLAANGVHPKVAQSIMRHCTIDLTMSRYSHVFAGQEADAVAALPDLGLPIANEAKATGTDGPLGNDDGRDGPPRPPRPPRDGCCTRATSRQGNRSGEAGALGREQKTGSARLALFLAQGGDFRGISPDLGEPGTRPERDPENTGKPLENTGECGLKNELEVNGSLVAPLVFKTSVGLNKVPGGFDSHSPP